VILGTGGAGRLRNRTVQIDSSVKFMSKAQFPSNKLGSNVIVEFCRLEMTYSARFWCIFMHIACNSTMLIGATLLGILAPGGGHLHPLATPVVPGIGVYNMPNICIDDLNK